MAKSKTIACPQCGDRVCLVVDTRAVEEQVRRRRRCSKCQHRFTTYETMGDPKSKNGRTTPEEIIAAAIVEAFGMMQGRSN